MKKTLGLTLVLVFVLGLSAAFAETNGYKIGFANGYYGNDWRSEYVEFIEKKFEEYKASGLLSEYQIANSNNDVTEQINQVNAMIAADYDAIIIDAVSPSSLGTVIAAAQEKGILVVICNATAPYEGVYSLGTSAFGQAYVGISWLCEKLGGEGNIIQLTGLAGNAYDVTRQETDAEVLSKYPGITVLGSAPANWSSADAQSAMSTFISTYGNKIDGVVCQDGGEPEGVIQAFENAGMDVPYVTGDYTASFINYWYENQNSFTSVGAPSAPSIGYKGVVFTMNLLQGRTVKEEYVKSNPVEPNVKNYVELMPPYIIVSKDQDLEAEYLQPYYEAGTSIITIDEAYALCEGKSEAYVLDMLDGADESIEMIFN